MIVRDFNALMNTDRVVSDAQWTSVRMLLADDGMGFSFHITFLEAGSEHEFEYKNHFESVYCMQGKGSITDHATGETHEIKPGVIYALMNMTGTRSALRRNWSWPAYSTRPLRGGRSIRKMAHTRSQTANYIPKEARSLRELQR